MTVIIYIQKFGKFFIRIENKKDSRHDFYVLCSEFTSSNSLLRELITHNITENTLKFGANENK